MPVESIDDTSPRIDGERGRVRRLDGRKLVDLASEIESLRLDVRRIRQVVESLQRG